MSTQHVHDARGESLSALFDGQLDREATWSALEQLGDDAGARRTCGRWQLAGDVLRGNAMAPAAPGFADRVMARVALEQGQGAAVGRGAFSGASASRGRVRHPPRWIGGALAASVAVAALFVARPMFDRDAATADTSATRQTVSASTGTASAPDGLANESPADAGMPFPGAFGDTGGPGADLAAAAVAAAATGSARRGEHRNAPVAARSVAGAGARSSRDTLVARVDSDDHATAALASVTHSQAVQQPRPFMPASAIVAKPWPRAVVPGYGADTAMTAGFHVTGQASAPVSFYPFEPAGLRSDALRGSVERGPLPVPAPEPAPGASVLH